MLAPSPTEPSPGTILGEFRLVTELGSGGMGTVYFAEHQTIGRRAAIKVLRAEIAVDRDMVTRFLAEARAVNEIRHPNVVQITDLGQWQGRPYIVMELLEGETLGERLERIGRCDEVDAIRITDQIASALGAAHERGIVHRDLKPENVFLTNHPDYPDQVKVLDFGIAKLSGQAALPAANAHTQTGTLMGTPSYMSPEQCRGERDIDQRSDIYSLGVVLYEMLTGETPFGDRPVGALIIAHAVEAPPPLRERVPKLRQSLEQVVLRALEKDPAQRFSTMAELRGALVPRSVKPATAALRTGLPTPASSEAAREARPVADKLTEIVLSRIAGDRLALPSMPGVAMECMTVVRDPRQTFAGVAAIGARDPLLASRLLKLANSAMYRRREPATNIEAAISRLGTEGLVAALVEFSMEEVFLSRDERIRAAFQGIWDHSLATALVARELAVAARPYPIDANAAYLGGLLHDIGKPVVASLLLDAERQLGSGEGGRWISGEVWRSVVQGCHRVVGHALAQSWKLPAEVAETVRDVATFDSARPRSAQNVVRVANAVAKQAGLYVGDVDVRETQKIIGAGRAVLGIRAEAFDAATRGLSARVRSVREQRQAS